MTPLRWGGIIAAGEGSRLSAFPMAKPLVPVAGRPLVDWALEAHRAAGVRRLVVLLNSRGDAVREHLRGSVRGMDLVFLKRDTASSWESFRLVSRTLAGQADRFMLSTVDTVLSPADAGRFGRTALLGRASAALGLTRFVDDEKPLWADLGPDGRIAALGEDAVRRDAVTCGLYALSGRAVRAMPEARAHARLRDYWRALVRAGESVRGVVLEEAVDVDRPEDIAAAGKLAARWKERDAL